MRSSKDFTIRQYCTLLLTVRHSSSLHATLTEQSTDYFLGTKDNTGPSSARQVKKFVLEKI